MSVTLKSGAGTDLAEVSTDKNLLTNTPYTDQAGVNHGGGDAKAGAMILLSESDKGRKNGVRSVIAPEADSDFRLRVALETLLEEETFNYTAQNTGKHIYSNTTLALAWNTGGLLTNSGGITTTTTGANFSTRAYFPVLGSGALVYVQFKGAFSALPVANTIIDAGLFIPGAANPYTPVDGAFFRLNSSGLVGVINHNGTETQVPLTFTYTINRVYEFLVTIQEGKVKFWIDDELYGEIPTPEAQGQPMMAAAAPFSIRHAITGGAAGGILQFTLRDYSISIGGINLARSLSEYGNASFGSYQGLSGGTMGGLTAYTNNTNPTAAVPSNTALTANLPAGLGGQAWETFSLAVNTDGILMSYQVPAGTVSISGKRLKVTGVKLSSFVQTVLAGGPLNRTFSLNFGHTAASLATAEAATTKARRVVLLPELTQAVTANQAVNTMISQPGGCVSLFPEPIYVNPGEFISVSVKHIGTVGTTGTIATNIQLIYSWE